MQELPNIMTCSFAEPTRFQTGIKAFDDAFRSVLTNETGIPQGSANLLTGEPGTGKTTFIMHLLDGMSQRGCLTVLASNEQSRNTLASVAHRIQLKCLNVVLDDQFQTSDLIDSLMTLRQRYPNRQMVLAIDSLQGLNNDVRNSTARAWEDLEAFVKETNTILFLINHLRKDKVMAGAQVVHQRCDVKLHLGRSSESTLRLQVEKNRNGPAPATIENIAMTEHGLDFTHAELTSSFGTKTPETLSKDMSKLHQAITNLKRMVG